MADQEEKKAKADKTGADKAPKVARASRPPRVREGRRQGRAQGRRQGREAEAAREPEPKGPARLRAQFDEVIRTKLTEQFGYKNHMEVPRLDKIVLNMGVPARASTTARRSRPRPPTSP